MSAALLCHIGDAEFRPECWRTLAAAFDVPHIFVRGGTAPKGFVQDGPEHAKPGTLVCVVGPWEAPPGAQGLGTYHHPEDATYAFGPDYATGDWASEFERAEHVYISTGAATQLHSFTAAAIVLYDRGLVKHGDH